MLVGEAPGADEEKERRPFVGAAGKLLRQWLQEMGIDPEEIFFTNICKHRPPANKLDKFFADGGIPKGPVIDGLAELMDEIRQVRPNLIVALGDYALWALTGKAEWIDKVEKGERVRGFRGIQKWRGSILECTLVPGQKVIPTFHPTYLNHKGYSDHGTFLTDLDRIKREATFPEIRRPQRRIILASEQPQEQDGFDEAGNPIWEPSGLSRDAIKEWLLSSPSVPSTLDIEYAQRKLLCVGMTVERESAVVIPTDKLADHFYMESIVRETKSFNAQNSMFDASILEWHYNLPIMPRVTFDTMVAAYAANIELPKGLDYLISVYTDQPYHKDMVDWDLVKKGQLDFSILYAYNGIDAWTQHEVMEEQLRWDLDDPAVRRAFDFLMRLLVPLWDMSKRGIRIDLDLMSSVGEELEGEAAMKNIDLMLLAKSSTLLNVKSNKEIGELLYNQLGFPILKMNKTGPACDDKTLAALQLKATTEEQSQAITLIRQIRRARDLKSKFFDIGFDKDGRMRGHYDPTKTVTGRLASRKFYPTGLGTNQQNIPRDKRARRAFLADRGKIFGYADLEKAESLVVAHLTMDPLMLFDHSPGQNAHRNLGAKLFNKAPEDLDEDEYYLCKKTRHAGNYMQGPLTFMRNVNQDAHKTGVSINQKEATFFIGTYKGIHAGLPRWWKETEGQLYASRTLKNLLGFSRIFYNRVSRTLPEAVAFVPQSTVGQTIDIGLLTLEGIPSPYLEERGIWEEYEDIAEQLRECGFELLQQVHDAVGFQVNANAAERAAPLIRRALSVPLTNPKTYEDFTIPVEILMDLDPTHVREGRSNWGDTKPYVGDLHVS